MVLENQSFPLLLLSPGPGKSLLMRMEQKFTKAGGWDGLEGDQDPALGSLGLVLAGRSWGSHSHHPSVMPPGPTVTTPPRSVAGTRQGQL